MSISCCKIYSAVSEPDTEPDRVLQLLYVNQNHYNSVLTDGLFSPKKFKLEVSTAKLLVIYPDGMCADRSTQENLGSRL